MKPSRGVSAATLVMSQLGDVVGPNDAIAPMIIPPDGGWGWIIVLVGLLATCIVDGCIYCIYLFRVPMSKELNTKEGDISFLTAITTGFYFIGALFACSFGNHWGFRITMLIGATVSSLSYASGYFLQEIIYYYIFVGGAVGLASGFISVGAVLPAGFYFDKKRAVAMGIVSCGSGLGGFIMPYTLKLFMDTYGWRITFLFEASMFASLIFLSLLIRPLKPVLVVINPKSSLITLRPVSDSIIDFSAFRIPADLQSSFQSTRLAGDTVSMTRSVVSDRPLTVQPTILQMVEDLDIINVRVAENVNPNTLTRLQGMIQSRQTSQLLQTSASAVFNNIHISEDPVIQRQLPWYKCGCCRSKYAALPHRPLLRTDLYYTGNLHRLPEYTDTNKDIDYHLLVTRMPTFYQTVQDMTKNCSMWCCHNIITGLGYLIDYKLFMSPAFMCLALCGFGIYLTYYLPYVFIKVHLEQSDVEENMSNSSEALLSINGFGTMVGRITSGLIIVKCPKFEARTVTSFMTFVASIAITCMVLLNNLYCKCVCMFIFGYSIGFYLPMRSLIVVDYFGLQKLTSGTGVLIVCVGCASFLGPVIGEKAMDYTNNSNVPFYFCGISLVFATISLWPMSKLSKWEKRRTARKKGFARRS